MSGTFGNVFVISLAKMKKLGVKEPSWIEGHVVVLSFFMDKASIEVFLNAAGNYARISNQIHAMRFSGRIGDTVLGLAHKLIGASDLRRNIDDAVEDVKKATSSRWRQCKPTTTQLT